MPRTLTIVLALLAMMSVASAEPLPAERSTLLFAIPHTDNRLTQSLSVGGLPHLSTARSAHVDRSCGTSSVDIRNHSPK
jgi:hypothetical protein